jgi:hypothetical protein
LAFSSGAPSFSAEAGASSISMVANAAKETGFGDIIASLS